MVHQVCIGLRPFCQNHPPQPGGEELVLSCADHHRLVKAAVCARDAGAAFVKTSTGYFGEGAKTEDVRLLKETVKGACSVKASGGIRDAVQFRAMLGAGADRIGTSSGVAIAESLKKEL